MVIVPAYPPPPKSENKIKFSQAVAYKLKHKDKITRNHLKNYQAKLKIMEMQPEKDQDKLNEVAENIPLPPKEKRRFVDFIIKFRATDGSPGDSHHFLK